MPAPAPPVVHRVTFGAAAAAPRREPEPQLPSRTASRTASYDFAASSGGAGFAPTAFAAAPTSRFGAGGAEGHARLGGVQEAIRRSTITAMTAEQQLELAMRLSAVSA